MKKQLCLTLALLICLSLLGCGQQEQTYRLTEQLHESYYKGELVMSQKSTCTYNEQGWRDTWTVTEGGEITEKRTYTHDEYGNTLTTTKAYPDGTETLESHALTLDEAHRIIRDEVTTYGTLTSISEYTYDEAGRMTSQKITRKTPTPVPGEIITITTVTYDAQGNQIRQDDQSIVGGREGEPSYTLTEYKDGKLCQNVRYSQSGQVLSSAAYSYDETGREETVISANADGTPTSKSVTTYDEHGNLVCYMQYFADMEHPGTFSDHPDAVSIYTYEPTG